MHHILIVDDSESIAYLLRRYFERSGIRVSVASKGKTAKQIAHDDPIDGLVTDFKMPDMNGEELVAQLRAITPLLPVIFVSAFTPDIGPEDSKTKVFSKPMEPDQVVHQMLNMIADAETTQLMQSGEQRPDIPNVTSVYPVVKSNRPS